MKVSDNFFYGEGKIGKNKVLVNGSANKSFEKELNKYHAVYLVNYKAKVETIMPATNPGEFDYQNIIAVKKSGKELSLRVIKFILSRLLFLIGFICSVNF